MNIEKAKNHLRYNLFFIVVALAAAVYLVRGFVTIVETGKTVWEILADGALGATFAFLIGKLMSLQGLSKGSVNDRVVATNQLHGQTVESIAPYIDRLDEWCEIKNREALYAARSKILSFGGVTMAEFESDTYRVSSNNQTTTCDYKHLPGTKKRIVRRARKLHLTQLSAGALTTDGGKKDDPYDFGPDKIAYERRRDLRQIFTKIVCGLLFGYFGVQLIEDFSWSQLIWTAIQVVTFLSMGVIAYLQAYFFVVDNDRQRIIRKIDNLQKFRVWSEQSENERNKLEEVVPHNAG